MRFFKRSLKIMTPFIFLFFIVNQVQGSTSAISATSTADCYAQQTWPYYQFVATGSSHAITLSVPTGAKYNLGAWNASGTPVGNSSNSGSTNESFTMSTTPGAKYFVKVSKVTGVAQYSLTIN